MAHATGDAMHPPPFPTSQEPVSAGLYTVSVIRLIFLVLGCCVVYWQATKKRYSLPPGPFNFPVLGCLLLLDHKKPFATFAEWARQYGRMYFCKLGGDSVIILNDAALVKEAFNSDLFQNRPRNIGADLRKAESGGHCGLIFADGVFHRDSRRFVMRSLKDFGVGRRSIEDKIAEEAAYLMQIFREFNGEPFDDKVPVGTAVANVISNVVANTRYEADDPEFVKVLQSVAALFRTSFASAMLNSYPKLRFIPPFRGVYNAFDRCAKIISSYFGKVTNEHFETWKENSNRDLMDAYISALKRREYGDSFSEKDLAYLVEDLMEAGYETTTTSLRWAFLLMATHPEIQKKVQAELDANIPSGASARPSAQLDLSYTEAVIVEVQRFASIVPFGVMHEASFDTKLENFDVPKGTWLLPNLYFIHHDEQLWDEPFVFKPERFLSADGKLGRLPDYYLPFSLGKRRCPGESLAIAEMTMFFSAVMRNFWLTLPEGAVVDILAPLPGPTLDPPPHRICAAPR